MIKRLWLSLRGWWDRKTPPRLNLYCENCGERLTNRHFCRACGASDESGWAPPDLAEDDDDDFDYDEFVQREFGRKSGRPRNVAATTWGTILIVLVVIGLLLTQFGGLL